MVAQGALLDQPHLLRFIRTLLPDMTFAESLRHSRRILNISVSPYKTVQSPRLLNYLSAPQTLIHHTALASSAVPGAFKPVQLMTRQRGKVSAWMKGELWVDGSVSNDLPFTQLAQLLNINHFITSQANPHVVPFQSLSGENRSSLSSLARMSGGIAFDSWSRVLDVARRKQPLSMMRTLMNTAHGLVSQRYASTDMHIQMPFRLSMYPKVLTNPSLEELHEFIRLGQQATWPQIPMIRDRTRISRVFGDCIGLLNRRIEAAGQTGQGRRRPGDLSIIRTPD
jgi:NTE family protein